MIKHIWKAALIAVMSISFNVAAHAQQPDWQLHKIWAGHNTNAGGAPNCPANYFQLGVGYFVANGGRAAVMRYAVAVAPSNPNAAFQLVLLTQCHSASAQLALLQAGEYQVLAYLPIALMQ